MKQVEHIIRDMRDAKGDSPYEAASKECSSGIWWAIRDALPCPHGRIRIIEQQLREPI